MEPARPLTIAGRRIPTPAASRRTHLIAASLLWSLVGAGLLATGLAWVIGAPAAPSGKGLALLLALAAGVAKARFVLARTARRIADRIESRGDDRCIGGFLSWKGWILVLAMMLLGRFLRSAPIPILARGAIYVAVGIALVGASLDLWKRWREARGAG